jgi:hypothetical protein
MPPPFSESKNKPAALPFFFWFPETYPSSRHRGCSVKTMTIKIRLQKEKSGHKPQEAWRQDGLIGGKQSVIK